MGSSVEQAESKDLLEEQFLNVLSTEQITTVFQPIVSLRDGSVYGYEALSRGPQNSEMQSPVLLFEYAKIYEKTWDLEFLCRVNAIKSFHKLQTKLKLFLNVNPQIIHDQKFKQGFTKEYLSQYDMNPENIVFEITEREAITNISDFVKTINNYKNQNYQIAIDDAGAGYSGLNLISDIHPHFIKLDINLIRDIDKDITKQSLIKSFTEFASLTNTYLIAEGIETEKELLKLIDIGVHYGQGFYLKIPEPTITPIPEHVLFTIKEANRKKNHLIYQKSSELFISNISANQKTFDPKILVAQIYEIMEKDDSISGVCILEEGCIVGIITRDKLYRHLSGQYGFSLYSKKPIESIMSTKFLQVDYHESIEIVAQKAMSRNFENLYDFISVTKEGKYYGVVTVKDLLEKAFQVQINNAKHLNPLSELPGNVLIEKKLESCIDSSTEYSVFYFDINNFKAYNDVYGFENGDRVIKCFAQILKRLILCEEDFVGHIGGDDFVAVLTDVSAEILCERIINEFERSTISFYNQNDLNKGYITTKNRHGVEEDFPLLSISIVGVSNKAYQTVDKMTEDMAGLKKICKQHPGSNYLIQQSNGFLHRWGVMHDTAE